MIKSIKKIIIHYYLVIKYRKCRIISYDIHPGIKLNKKNLITRKVAIGKNVSIGDYSYINSSYTWTIIESNTTIGKYCSIGPGVSIGYGNHDYTKISTHPFLYNTEYGFVSKSSALSDDRDNTIIGNDVWIGANANIKRGIIIGDGAIIAMNAVVTKDVPPYAIVAGVPAKIIKYRFDKKTIHHLETLRWWDMPKETIVKNICYMHNPKKFININKNKNN